MAKMRAVVIKNGKGPADALYIDDIEKPTAAKGQAIVRIRAFGLNRMDLMQREGNYPVPPQAPSTLGVEFSGEIESLAPGAERTFKVGDAVFGLAYGGAYAEYIAISTHMLVHKPDELSWEQTASIPETWITALQALYLIGEWKPGKSVLWHAAASNVSIAGIQLARADGATKVFATARQDEKCRFVENELGADKAFNTETQDWAEEVLKATDGKGVDVVVDFIGGPTFGGNLKVAARDARIISLAFMGGTQPKGEANLAAFVMKRIRWEGSSLRSRDEDYQGKLRDQLVEHALPKFIDGSFKVPVEKVFDWKDVVEAHKLMESNKTKGKLICKIAW